MLRKKNRGRIWRFVNAKTGGFSGIKLPKICIIICFTSFFKRGDKLDIQENTRAEKKDGTVA